MGIAIAARRLSHKLLDRIEGPPAALYVRPRRERPSGRPTALRLPPHPPPSTGHRKVLPALKTISLKVLVFGPDPTLSHSPGFAADLSKKRAEIKAALIADGHEAVFPEDLWKGLADPSIDNPYLWEKSLVQEYDLIVSLVGSFGAVDELSFFHKPEYAIKATLFFCNDHTTGLPYSHAKSLEAIGITLQTYAYPGDLTGCHLMTQVRTKVDKVRIAKFLLS